jgi:benzoylformate decarboxylase
MVHFSIRFNRFGAPLARGYGCDAARLEDIGEIKKAAAKAWVKQKPTVLEIPISAEVPPLL